MSVAIENPPSSTEPAIGRGGAGASPPRSGRPRAAGFPALFRVGRILWRWLLIPIATILVSSFVIFLALSLAPGDPLASVLGSRPSPETRALLEQQYGLNAPLFDRYLSWIGGVLTGDLGQSIASRTSVWSLLEPRIGVTLFLVAYAGAIVVVVGLLAAVIGTVSRTLSPVVTLLSAVGVAVPAYVAASLLSIAFVLQLGWFPALGAGEGFTDRLWHLTLPAVALAIGWSAYLAQVARASLREEAGREHVETMVARGIPYASVFRRHVLRNAAVPIITVSSLVIGGLVIGSVIVEVAFGIDGIGSFFVKSVQTKDFAAVQAIALMLVVLFVVLTTLLDLLHAALDPRMRDVGGNR